MGQARPHTTTMGPTIGRRGDGHVHHERGRDLRSCYVHATLRVLVSTIDVDGRRQLWSYGRKGTCIPLWLPLRQDVWASLGHHGRLASGHEDPLMESWTPHRRHPTERDDLDRCAGGFGHGQPDDCYRSTACDSNGTQRRRDHRHHRQQPRKRPAVEEMRRRATWRGGCRQQKTRLLPPAGANSSW